MYAHMHMMILFVLASKYWELVDIKSKAAKLNKIQDESEYFIKT